MFEGASARKISNFTETKKNFLEIKTEVKTKCKKKIPKDREGTKREIRRKARKEGGKWFEKEEKATGLGVEERGELSKKSKRYSGNSQGELKVPKKRDAAAGVSTFWMFFFNARILFPPFFFTFTSPFSAVPFLPFAWPFFLRFAAFLPQKCYSWLCIDE